MNLLVTGAWQCAKDYISELEGQGHRVVFLQYEKEPLPCSYEWVEGVICNGLFLIHPIEKFVNLKYIQLTSAGMDRVPMEYIQEHRIEIHNARGVYSIPMAEYAVGGVLAICKQLPFFHENQKKHKWEKHRGLLELCGKTVCIVGCGSVGSECAKRFQAFGCRVVGIAAHTREQEWFEKVYALERLNEVLSEADVLVLAVPLSDTTKYLVNKECFDAMKSGAILVNISRGAVVESNALIEALKGKLGGAVLDVFEEEPIQENSPLWDMEHVIITPHNSFVGENNQKNLSQVILKNLFF